MLAKVAFKNYFIEVLLIYNDVFISAVEQKILLGLKREECTGPN